MAELKHGIRQLFNLGNPIENYDAFDVLRIKAQAELNRLVAEKTNEINVCPFEGVTHTAPTGEKYLTFMSHGYKGEGEKITKHFNWAQEAVDSFIKYLSDILIGGLVPAEYTLYWRKRPEVRLGEYGFHVRCRMLYSGKDINAEVVRGNVNG